MWSDLRVHYTHLDRMEEVLGDLNDVKSCHCHRVEEVLEVRCGAVKFV